MALKPLSGRKGIFFTLIAIMLMTILTIAFAPQEQVTHKDRVATVNLRVDTANDFVKRLKYSYMEESAETSGRHALLALVQFINRTTYLPDYNAVNTTFVEVFMNGSINGTPVECYLDTRLQPPIKNRDCEPLIPSDYVVMRDRSFLSRMRAMENASSEYLNIKVDFRDKADDYYVVFYQGNATGPWFVGINITANYSVDAGLASWNVSQTVSVLVPIEGVMDPVYLVNASFNNTIRATNSTVWNLSNLSRLIHDQSYRQSPKAPSLFMRLYYNMSHGGPGPAPGSVFASGSECCGIESMVNPNRLNRDPPYSISSCTPKSYLDWCFYSASCAPDSGVEKLWNVTGLTTYSSSRKFLGFKLTTEQAAAYNISDELVESVGKVECPPGYCVDAAACDNLPAQCNNQVQDGGEDGVDCGSVCPPCLSVDRRLP
ncbi:hypothetical protein HYY74_01275 [Candidatus Woesearchaeota archaeon]|nr:hypothetical protein [Candidatus Woesearchaeota archaeon]